MYPVIICGDCGDRTLTATLQQTCQRYGGILTADGGHIRQSTAEPTFLLMNVNTLSEVNSSGLVIFGEALCQVPPTLSLQKSVAITDTDNTDAVRLLRGTDSQVIGCSMSGRDTITLSGRNDNRALVCLLRTVTTLGGRCIEPCEVPVAVDASTPIYPLLAACCVLLLCDVPHQHGYEIGRSGTGLRQTLSYTQETE